MGLKSFLDNIIPNELKGNAGKILGVATAGYLGYKYAPSIYSSAKNFIGNVPSSDFGGPANRYGKAGSGMLGFVDKQINKYGDTKVGKFVSGFGKQVAGKAMQGESESDAKARYEAERARMEASIKNKAYNMPSVGQPMGVGSFSVSQARVPGFNNSNVSLA